MPESSLTGWTFGTLPSLIREARVCWYIVLVEVRQRSISLGVGRRDAPSLPIIQYSPVIEIARRIVNAMSTRGRVDFSNLKPSTISKSLATLEDLGFVVRKTGALTVTAKMREFAKNPNTSETLFRDAVIQLEAFSTFLQILNEFERRGATHLILGRTLRSRLSQPWKDGTAAIVAKVLLDWARHMG